MSEKQPFFYKETPQGQRINLGKDFINALLGDVNPNSLPQLRSKEK